MFFKLIHTINLFSILLSTVGIATYQHYCKEELKSVSFFIDLIVPCCPPKAPKQKKQKKETNCCSSKKACKLNSRKTERKKIKACCAHKLAQAKELVPCSSENKTVFKKKKCCEDKSMLSQDDIENNVDNAVKKTFNSISILPKTGTNLNFSKNSSNTWIPKTAYQFICFYPPPDIPLYIKHQAFLC